MEKPVNTKVYVVGVGNAEGCSIVSVHRTRKGARHRWNEVREKLISQFKRLSTDAATAKLWKPHIKRLQCKNPAKINNYPLETPHIWKYKLEE